MKKVFLALFAFALLGQTLLAQPQPATNLTATLEQWHGIPYVDLTWQGDTGNHIKYFIYKKFQNDNYTSKFFKLPFPARGTKYKDFFVSPGFTYSYYIIARNRDGESAPSDTVTIEVQKVVRNSVLTGVVTDENTGSPLKHVWVYAVRTDKAMPAIQRTNGEGQFKFRLSAGDYYVRFFKYGYLPEFYNDKKFITDADKITLADNDSLVITAALTKFDSTQIFTLSGTVTDSSGNPVKARIKTFSLQGRMFTRISKPGFTDSLGNYSVKVVKGDSVAVFMRPFNRREYKPEFYNDKKDFREADKIFIDGDVQGINFVADSKPTYENLLGGKVTDENSTPLQAVVALIRLKDNHRKPRHRRIALTDSLGNYQFTNVVPGKYIAFAMARGGFVPTFYRADSEQTFRWKKADTLVIGDNTTINGIDFTLHSRQDSGFGLIRGYVKDNSSNPLEGVMVYAVDTNNNIAASSSTEKDGSYRIDGLIPGSYSLYFEKVGFKEASAQNVTLDYSQNVEATADADLNEEPVTSVENNGGLVIDNYKLFQNYPNPFNPTTVIKYAVPNESFVTLKVYNLLGEEVKTLVNGYKKSGIYEVNFNAKNLGSGVYFYSLKAGNFYTVRKMILLK